MEDGDQDIRPIAGRLGAWFTLNDGTSGASQTPAGLFIMSVHSERSRREPVCRAHQRARIQILGPALRFLVEQAARRIEATLRRAQVHRHQLLGTDQRDVTHRGARGRSQYGHRSRREDLRRSWERRVFGSFREEHRGHRHLGEACDQVRRLAQAGWGHKVGELRGEDVVRGRVSVRSGERVRLLDR